ncbi:MAG TPA: sigma-70 family RNA polymerase sigma factor [Anaerolineales bacterium]|nr:sigma-70 family RNA polymerase sigma factor [Anaerolineales bacterium]
MSSTRTNQEWLHDLNASGSVQEAAIADLRDLLLRAALYFFSRNLGDFQGLDRDEIMQRAEDCAQDALIAVLNRLSDFRGDSKFTTWAYKFAINMAMTAARRERWKGVSLDELASADKSNLFEWLMEDKSQGVGPEQVAMQAEMRATLREVIERELTEKQRRVLILMVFHEVPMDEVVRHLGTNRNAVYKLLHDARRKLKSGLQARGIEIGETLTLFDPSG